MVRKATKRFILAGLMGSALAASPLSAAQEHTLAVKTRSLTPPPGGSLHCTVTATSTDPIGIVATIVDDQGTNVTAYGSGFRASPEVTGDGSYYAEQTAGTVSDGAGLCDTVVTGARKRDIRVILTSHGPNNEEVDRVER